MIEQKYSTFRPRFFAGYLDAIIFWPLGLIYSFTFSHLDSVLLRIFACIVTSSAPLIYSIWMHGKYGQTLGKMACKIVVLDVSEQSLTMRQAVLRDILGLILLCVGLTHNIPRIVQGIDISAPPNLLIVFSGLGLFLVEIVTMFTNDKRRALHDFIAGSVVIRKPSKEESQQEPRSGFRPVAQG